MSTKTSLGITDQVHAAFQNNKRLFAALIDPEEVCQNQMVALLNRLPHFTTHILVGGSTASYDQTWQCVATLKSYTDLPVVLFPGSHKQLVPGADAVLFLSLLSGRNADYLIGEQVNAVPFFLENPIEIIPTAYILVDGGRESSVARVSGTSPIAAEAVDQLVHTALAGQYGGKKLIYLEAGSGATKPIDPDAVNAVCSAVRIPVAVGGGIKSKAQMDILYDAGAQMIVVGSAFENRTFKEYAL